jgi:release factor glutamine methyltransferase
MRKLLRSIVLFFYKPYALRKISKDDVCRYNNLTLFVPKGVFHPLLFFSTKFLAAQINLLDLEGKTFLDLGCGSGLLSLVAARKHARVTAVDINPLAINATEQNLHQNLLSAEVLLSDMFGSLKQNRYDFIVINPPYYKKEPQNVSERAWFAGSNYQYFQKLFMEISMHVHGNSEVLLVVSEDVDLATLSSMAEKNGIMVSIEKSQIIFFELNHILRLRVSHSIGMINNSSS